MSFWILSDLKYTELKKHYLKKNLNLRNFSGFRFFLLNIMKDDFELYLNRPTQLTIIEKTAAGRFKWFFMNLIVSMIYLNKFDLLNQSKAMLSVQNIFFQ